MHNPAAYARTGNSDILEVPIGTPVLSSGSAEEKGSVWGNTQQTIKKLNGKITKTLCDGKHKHQCTCFDSYVKQLHI